MNSNSYNPNAFDHLDAAEKLNKAILLRCRTGEMTPEWFITMATAQARNLDAIRDMISAKIAEFHDLPASAMHALNAMIKDGQESLEIDLEGAADDLIADVDAALEAEGSNVVKLVFGKPFVGGRNDR